MLGYITGRQPLSNAVTMEHVTAGSSRRIIFLVFDWPTQGLSANGACGIGAKLFGADNGEVVNDG